MSDTPKLYTHSEAIAAEWRKMYPGIEIVVMPKRIPTTKEPQA